MSKRARKRIRESSQREAWAKLLAEIDAKFPTEESRVRELRKHKPVGGRCRSCKGEIIELEDKPRQYRCLRCGKRGAYLQDTVFAGISHTRAWLVAVIFMEEKVKINAFQFHQLVGIAYSTARDILLKLGIVSTRALENHASAVRVSAYAFRDTFGRRSRVTGSHIKPRQEQYFDETKLAKTPSDVQQTTEQNELESKAAELRKEFPQIDALRKLFTQGEILQIDDICEQMPDVSIGSLRAVLTIAEIHKLMIRLPGDHYALWAPDFVCPFSFRCICADKDQPERKCPYHMEKRRKQQFFSRQGVHPKKPPKPTTNDGHVLIRVHSIKVRIRRCQYYISRKYLQIYIALTWCATDRIEWGRGKLLEACASSKRITQQEISAFNTPDTVVVLPPRRYKAA